MKRNIESNSKSELDKLCELIRTLVSEGNYSECVNPICQAMVQFPHAPHPHNLLGIVLERQGDHVSAMKHFRAAWALDPTYSPANQNLEIYGTFYSVGKVAFDESDVSPVRQGGVAIAYEKKDAGNFIRR